MYRDLAWNNFVKTGNLEFFLEFKKLEELEKKGEIIDETYQGERNSNKRSNL